MAMPNPNPARIIDGVFIRPKGECIARLRRFMDHMPDSIEKIVTMHEAELSREGSDDYRLEWRKARQLYLIRKKENKLEEKFGIQHEELHIALIFYTSEMYADFNGETRNVLSDEDFNNYNYMGLFTLLHLAIIQFGGKGHPGKELLFRCNDLAYRTVLDPAVHSFAFPTYTSTSYKKRKEFLYHDGTGTTFKFQGRIQNCLSLKHHSKYPDEAEVLVWPFAYFNKTKHFTESEHPRGHYKVTLQNDPLTDDEMIDAGPFRNFG